MELRPTLIAPSDGSSSSAIRRQPLLPTNRKNKRGGSAKTFSSRSPFRFSQQRGATANYQDESAKSRAAVSDLETHDPARLALLRSRVPGSNNQDQADIQF